MAIRQPSNQLEWTRYLACRKSVLSGAGYPTGSTSDKIDEERGRAYHLALFHGNYVLSVGRVHMISERGAQISYLATSKEYQGRGHGSQILNGLEQFALANGKAQIITIETPESAQEFFKKNGYIPDVHQPNNGRSIRFGRIPFQSMKKQLKK